jgi:hypothetical protein
VDTDSGVGSGSGGGRQLYRGLEWEKRTHKQKIIIIIKINEI